LSRPSTSFFLLAAFKNVDARDKPGHDEPKQRRAHATR
jgi:hypothetical protein